mmetsp:Transcript_18381/g.45122  ORF Transcript_18381/g.45122 Transcript_18381/m.45122 type:complete len:232 (+) Transcript_18381:468-1163(+)
MGEAPHRREPALPLVRAQQHCGDEAGRPHHRGNQAHPPRRGGHVRPHSGGPHEPLAPPRAMQRSGRVLPVSGSSTRGPVAHPGRRRHGQALPRRRQPPPGEQGCTCTVSRTTSPWPSSRLPSPRSELRGLRCGPKARERWPGRPTGHYVPPPSPRPHLWSRPEGCLPEGRRDGSVAAYLGPPHRRGIRQHHASRGQRHLDRPTRPVQQHHPGGPILRVDRQNHRSPLGQDR